MSYHSLRYIFATIFSFFLYSLFAVDESKMISSNPGAVNIETGTGILGEKLGFKKDSGIRFGGLLIEDLNYLFQGGLKPKKWSGNSIF